ENSDDLEIVRELERRVGRDEGGTMFTLACLLQSLFRNPDRGLALSGVKEIIRGTMQRKIWRKIGEKICTGAVRRFLGYPGNYPVEQRICRRKAQ
ncbi:hypothetical protein U1Q18_032167, partial [Sarracenia purpurea var. burkii]